MLPILKTVYVCALALLIGASFALLPFIAAALITFILAVLSIAGWVFLELFQMPTDEDLDSSRVIAAEARAQEDALTEERAKHTIASAIERLKHREGGAHEPVKLEFWWDTLKVSKRPTRFEVSQAYRRLCYEIRPDLPGCDRKRWDKVQKAHQRAERWLRQQQDQKKRA